MTPLLTKACALLAVCVLTAACASSDTPAADPEAASQGAAQQDDGDSGDRGTEKEKKESKGRAEREPKKDGGGDHGPGSDDDGGGSGRDAAGGSGGEGGNGSGASVAYPAAGTYVYAQEGYEEVCSAGCDRDPLPARQKIDASYDQRTAAGAVVVTDARASSDRLVRTVTVYTAERAEITEVHIEYAFGGFDFSTTYQPSPPPDVLHLPLSAGDEWSGEWSARTSGDYSVAVAGRDPVSVGGTSVDAYRLDTVTRFRGELEGRAVATVWIDPATNSVLASDGEMHLSTQFGRYNTAFQTALRSGPGY